MPTKFCRHIRVNGERCGARALANQIFCYFHVELERRHRCLNRPNKLSSELSTILHPMSFQDGAQRDPSFAEPTGPPFQLDLPPLEDRHSIQVALSLVITALAEGRIDPKRAAMLFYGLQVASSNAHKLNPLPLEHKRIATIRETILHEPTGEQIAPDQDSDEDSSEDSSFDRPLNSGDILYAKIVRARAEREEAERDGAERGIVRSAETES